MDLNPSTEAAFSFLLNTKKPFPLKLVVSFCPAVVGGPKETHGSEKGSKIRKVYPGVEWRNLLGETSRENPTNWSDVRSRDGGRDSRKGDDVLPPHEVHQENEI